MRGVTCCVLGAQNDKLFEFQLYWSPSHFLDSFSNEKEMNVLLFGRMGSGKTSFVNSIQKIWTNDENASPGSSSVDDFEHSTKAVELHDQYKPLVVYDVWGLDGKTYSQPGEFNALLDGFVLPNTRKDQPDRVNFDEATRPLDVVLFFVPVSYACEDMEDEPIILRTKHFLKIAQNEIGSALLLLSKADRYEKDEIKKAKEWAMDFFEISEEYIFPLANVITKRAIDREAKILKIIQTAFKIQKNPPERRIEVGNPIDKTESMVVHEGTLNGENVSCHTLLSLYKQIEEEKIEGEEYLKKRTNSFRFALAKQQFPNILLTHGCYNIQNRLWMVNEMTEMSLERAMREGMTIDRDDVAMQIACGLKDLHFSVGFYHGNLTPNNILLQVKPGTQDYIVKLADFHYNPPPCSSSTSFSMFFCPGDDKTEKGDMFSYGVVVLSMWVGLQELIEKNDLYKVIDEFVHGLGNYDNFIAKDRILDCFEPEANRPTSAQIYHSFREDKTFILSQFLKHRDFSGNDLQVVTKILVDQGITSKDLQTPGFLTSEDRDSLKLGIGHFKKLQNIAPSSLPSRGSSSQILRTNKEEEEKQEDEGKKEGGLKAWEEFVETEKSFVENMEILQEEYCKPMSLRFPNIELVSSLFERVEMLRIVKENFNLNINVENVDRTKLFEGLKVNITVFKSFAMCHETRQRALDQAIEHPVLSPFLKDRENELQQKSQGSDKSLGSLLMQPVQRGPRYQLLLKDVIERLKKEENEESQGNLAEWERVYLAVEDELKKMNEAMREFDGRKRLLEIDQELLKSNRKLIKEEEISLLSPKGLENGILLVLCNDILYYKYTSIMQNLYKSSERIELSALTSVDIVQSENDEKVKFCVNKTTFVVNNDAARAAWMTSIKNQISNLP